MRRSQSVVMVEHGTLELKPLDQEWEGLDFLRCLIVTGVVFRQ